MLYSDYFLPETLDECLSLLDRCKADIKIAAGGTDLLPRIKSGKDQPKAIMDISRLGLNTIHENERVITIGAMTDLTKVQEYFESSSQPFQVLSKAAGQIGSWQIRNVATIGGNICTGNSSADLAVALLALGAEFTVLSISGKRIVPANRFFLYPRSVDLQYSEILTEISVDKTVNKDYRARFMKIGKRKGHCIAIANIAVVMKTHPDKVFENIRIAAGTLAPTPIRLFKTEMFLKGKQKSESIIEKAKDVMRSEISPRTSFRSTKDYRLHIATVLLDRALKADTDD